MKRLLLSLSLALALAQAVPAALAHADGACPGLPSSLYPMATSYQALTVSSTAIGLTVPAGARMATIQVETNSVRHLDDGSAPTASRGKLRAAGAEFVVCTAAISAIRFIRVTSDATVNAEFYW